MKIGLVISDSLRQIALTPEDDQEKGLLELLHTPDWQLEIKRGEFFVCRGGYVRFGNWPSDSPSGDQSTFLVLHQSKRPAVKPGTDHDKQ